MCTTARSTKPSAKTLSVGDSTKIPATADAESAGERSGMIVKLKPALKSYLWGGSKLNYAYGKTGIPSVAEAWELSFREEGASVIDGGAHDGELLSAATTRADWGENCKDFEFFPVLNKLIDAALPLSIQVHPDDKFALEREGQYGKTEMWHILDAEPSSYIYLGFNRNMSARDFEDAVNCGKVCDCLTKCG